MPDATSDLNVWAVMHVGPWVTGLLRAPVQRLAIDFHHMHFAQSQKHGSAVFAVPRVLPTKCFTTPCADPTVLGAGAPGAALFIKIGHIVEWPTCVGWNERD